MAENETEGISDPQDFTGPSPDPESDADLAVLGDALQEHGVTRVVIRYEGSGDSGSVGDVEMDPVDATPPRWVADRLGDVAEGYCPPGYENNEGGYGTLTVYPALGLAERVHHDRYEDTEAMGVQPATLPEELRRQLTALGVRRVAAHFDGCGDSGQFDDVTVTPGGGELDPGVWDELEDFLLEQLPGGWEINEGSFGMFRVAVRTGRVTAEAYGRVEQDGDAQVTRWKWR